MPHLDYADVIFDQPNNESFSDFLETVQYRASLAITGAIKGTSRDRLYLELGLESLRDRRWYRRLVYFFNIVSGRAPEYLQERLPVKQNSRNSHRKMLFRNFNTKSEYYRNYFFPYCIGEWNKLSPEIKQSQTISIFKKKILEFIRPKKCSIYGIHDPEGLKLLTRLRLQLSHLREHKFKHNFSDTLNPLCPCQLLETESTMHYLLRCPFYNLIRATLLSEVKQIMEISELPSEWELTNILLYGDPSFSRIANSSILSCTIDFIKASERFDCPLM